MMAKAKMVFARRNTLGLSSPQPAFLLGVPPPNARISGIETEGQPSMGEPSSVASPPVCRPDQSQPAFTIGSGLTPSSYALALS